MTTSIGVILCTALIPTKGHQYLIDFSNEFMKTKNGHLFVIVCTRSKEPKMTLDRIHDFRNQYNHPEELSFCGYHNNPRITFCEFKDDDAPQNPEDHPDFWNYWKHVVISFCGAQPNFYFASEKYGNNMAELFDRCDFVPVDIGRQIVSVKGSDTREDMLLHWGTIMTATQERLRTTVTIFGAESTGKTTLSKNLSDDNLWHWTHEWARPFLEEMGRELSEAKMERIIDGQYATQMAAKKTDLDAAVVIQDTDLLATIGYYRIMGVKEPQHLVDKFNATKSDLYLVMNTGIPFEVDPLRYGGDKRESDTKFWIDLLEEFDCTYQLILETGMYRQIFEAEEIIEGFIKTRFMDIETFERE